MELTIHTPFVPQGVPPVPPVSKPFDLTAPKAVAALAIAPPAPSIQLRYLATKLIHQPDELAGVSIAERYNSSSATVFMNRFNAPWRVSL